MIASLWLIYLVTILNFDLCVMWPLLCITNLPPPLSHTYYTCPPPWLSTNGTKISFQTDHLIIPHILINYTGDLIKTKLLQKHARYTYIGTQTCGRNKIYVYNGIKETWEVYTAKRQKAEVCTYSFPSLTWVYPPDAWARRLVELPASRRKSEHQGTCYGKLSEILCHLWKTAKHIFISLTYPW